MDSIKNLVNATLPVPSGKLEYTDGSGWYNLATENFVINSLIGLTPCLATTTGVNLSVIYANGTAGNGATLTSTTVGIFTLDGVTPPLNSRVLIKDQATQFQNGIYVVTNPGSASTPWILTRSNDYSSVSQIAQGSSVNISSGTLNGVTSWMQTAVVTAIGTSAIVFALLAKNGINNVVGTTNQISVSVANNIATLSLSSNPVFPGTASATLPGGTTLQRPGTLTAGMIRYNNGS